MKIYEDRRFFILMLIFLVALVVADGTITRFLVKNDLGTEANPFLKNWVSSDLLLMLKLGGAALASFILWLVYKRKPLLAWWVTISSVLIYITLILWNLVGYFLTIHTV